MSGNFWTYVGLFFSTIIILYTAEAIGQTLVGRKEKRAVKLVLGMAAVMFCWLAAHLLISCFIILIGGW